MTITLTALQKQRRDTASNWTSNNTVLLAGEWGIESDTKKFKIGDGTTAWQSLDYVPIPDTNRLLTGNLTVGGNFTVNGTTTTIDTTTLTVEDKNIEIGKVSTPSDTTADGGGITLKGSTDKTINWIDSTDSWTLSEHLDLASGKVLKVAGTQILSATQYTGNSATTTALGTARTIGGVSFDGTANINLPGVNTAGTQNTTGSAATLTNPRNIAGVAFDGSANISLNNNAITNGAGYITGSALNASNLSSGTIPDARFPATLPAVSGANLTNLPAAGIANVVDDLSPQLGGDLQSNGNDIDFADNDKAVFGTGGDLKIDHNGTRSKIENITGDLKLSSNSIKLTNYDDDETYLTCVDDGAVKLYHNNVAQIQTTADGVGFFNNCTFSDNKIAKFGDGNDLQIYHDGSTNIIDAATSNAISFRRGNSEQFFIGDSEFKGGDNKKIKLGTSDDLQIFHDGNNSFIKDAGTGRLSIVTSQLQLTNAADSEVMIKATENGAVELFFNGVKKFETLTDGVNITGTLKVNGSAFSGGGGITMAQQWRQHTNTSNPSSITQNWEINDNGIYASIGSNMTEAAGVFTFPSTGIYYIAVDQTFHVTSNGEDRRCEIHIQTTTNNSSYEDIAIGYTNLGVGSSTTFGTASCATFVNITDVSNRKVRFTASVNNSNTQLTGNSGYNENSYVFIRLGDT